MQLALYKGPPSDPIHWLTHVATCAATLSRYSHCELVIEGICYSASARDGGVRAKRIDLNSGRWDVIEINGDDAFALEWFRSHIGAEYDWTGALRFLFPILRHRRGLWFCSEACAAALGLPSPWRWTPGGLARHFNKNS